MTMVLYRGVQFAINGCGKYAMDVWIRKFGE